MAGSLILVEKAQAQDEFNAAFLQAGSSAASLEAVQRGDDIEPGTYTFSIYLNGEEVDQDQIEFVRDASGSVVPCLSADRLERYGVRIPLHRQATDRCYALEKQIPNTRVTYNPGSQRINLSIAQLYLNRLPQGAVPRRLWD